MQITTNMYTITTFLHKGKNLFRPCCIREQFYLGVGWRGYGQRNPLYEYKQDAFYMFETRKEVLRHLVIYDLLRSSIL